MLKTVFNKTSMKRGAGAVMVGVMATTGLAASYTPAQADPVIAWQLSNTIHDHADINLLPVMSDYSGKGCTVAVIEPPPKEDQSKDHDKKVAAFINNLGTSPSVLRVGSAPDATIGFFNLHESEAMKMQAEFDVSNHSWEGTYAYYKNDDFVRQIQQAARTGRDGKGTIFMTAAGNNNGDGHYGTIKMMPQVMSIGSIDKKGNRAGGAARGSYIFAAAPGDRVNTGMTLVSGTSFATPLASGVDCLLLEANSGLGYRDVQDIIAASSKRISSDRYIYGFNAAGQWNGGGFGFKNDFGFGLIDARAALRLAEVWPSGNPQTMDNLVVYSPPQKGAGIALRDKAAEGSTAISVAAPKKPMEIEHVRIDFSNFSYMVVNGYIDADQISMTLTSPQGTSVEVFVPPKNENCKQEECFNTISHHSTTPYFRGENPEGTWTLTLKQSGPSSETVAIKDWGISFTGRAAGPDDHYVFTDDFGRLAAKDGRRAIIEDRNGGKDIFNAAAFSGPVTLCMDGESAACRSQLGNTEIDVTPHVFEHVYTGDGNDRITGSSQMPQTIIGGRGDDVIIGKSQGNTYIYRIFNDSSDGDDVIYPVSGAKDRLVIDGDPGLLKITHDHPNLLIKFEKSAGSIIIPEWSPDKLSAIEFRQTGRVFSLISNGFL